MTCSQFSHLPENRAFVKMWHLFAPSVTGRGTVYVHHWGNEASPSFEDKAHRLRGSWGQFVCLFLICFSNLPHY